MLCLSLRQCVDIALVFQFTATSSPVYNLWQSEKQKNKNKKIRIHLHIRTRHTHTHTHTHTHMYARTHARTHTRARARANTQSHCMKICVYGKGTVRSCALTSTAQLPLCIPQLFVIKRTVVCLFVCLLLLLLFLVEIGIYIFLPWRAKSRRHSQPFVIIVALLCLSLSLL